MNGFKRQERRMPKTPKNLGQFVPPRRTAGCWLSIIEEVLDAFPPPRPPDKKTKSPNWPCTTSISLISMNAQWGVQQTRNDARTSMAVNFVNISIYGKCILNSKFNFAMHKTQTCFYGATFFSEQKWGWAAIAWSSPLLLHSRRDNLTDGGSVSAPRSRWSSSTPHHPLGEGVDVVGEEIYALRWNDAGRTVHNSEQVPVSTQ